MAINAFGIIAVQTKTSPRSVLLHKKTGNPNEVARLALRVSASEVTERALALVKELKNDLVSKDQRPQTSTPSERARRPTSAG